MVSPSVNIPTAALHRKSSLALLAVLLLFHKWNSTRFVDQTEDHSRTAKKLAFLLLPPGTIALPRYIPKTRIDSETSTASLSPTTAWQLGA